MAEMNKSPPATTPPAAAASSPASNPPAVEQKKDVAKRKRIPMSVPTQRLQVPELPGFHLHWFRESNVARAMQAAYEFVNDDEVLVTSRSVAANSELTGNTDLGTRIRVHSGQTENNHPEYLVLMKLPLEFWNEDRAAFDAAAAQKLKGIFVDEEIQDPAEQVLSGDDRALRYVKKAVFNRPTRKVRQARGLG